ncbi:MAG: hypothetical protein A2070_10165 [Bdellovibrionales bacterium GWC1_52_8]|nr:MAG: hypothetical protein A2Z97_02115 [Bdellovibrionales bacterium GWB1_52_6]OFZ02650.1 MAG: hypothetical protein A2X97_08370 [Bdellovibrionales bacterium GWA1_52_35]OFZ43786.1 MAG: hypothetical protein A2070_10165 [Bdellovibrionales bacterium GWC1_52_8]HCM41516.1 hypothetical protein [Bdellovibrionales bacterium]
MKRGRPKGRSNDHRSFGPLGDLIRSKRLEKSLGLLDLAKACRCSVQFVSNIEHGRAPLPWEKLPLLASALKIPLEELRAANLTIRSDFKSFVSEPGSRKQAQTLSLGHACAITFAARDSQLREVIRRYQSASPELRKKFMKVALQVL